MLKKKTLSRLFLLFLVFLICRPESGRAQTDKYYALHVSSFQDRINAEQEAVEFRRQGWPAFFRQEQVPGRGKWFRVYLGIYKSYREAQLMGERMQAQSGAVYFAVREVSLSQVKASGGRLAAGQPSGQPIKPLTASVARSGSAARLTFQEPEVFGPSAGGTGVLAAVPGKPAAEEAESSVARKTFLVASVSKSIDLRDFRPTDAAVRRWRADPDYQVEYPEFLVSQRRFPDRLIKRNKVGERNGLH